MFWNDVVVLGVCVFLCVFLVFLCVRVGFGLSCFSLLVAVVVCLLCVRVFDVCLFDCFVLCVLCFVYACALYLVCCLFGVCCVCCVCVFYCCGVFVMCVLCIFGVCFIWLIGLFVVAVVLGG